MALAPLPHHRSVIPPPPAILHVPLRHRITSIAQRPRDQDRAFREAQRGKIMPLPRIEQRAREHPLARGAQYLGPEFDEATLYAAIRDFAGRDRKFGGLNA